MLIYCLQIRKMENLICLQQSSSREIWLKYGFMVLGKGSSKVGGVDSESEIQYDKHIVEILWKYGRVYMSITIIILFCEQNTL